MAQRLRKRKPKLEAKYKTRRAMLTLLVVAALAAAVWLIWFQEPDPDKKKEASQDETTSQTESPSSSQPASSSQPEPESEPEPIPEPTVNTGDWNMLLVNSTSPLPDNFSVELETITDIYQVDKRIADNVRQMFNKAKEDGITLTIISAYRSEEKQEELFSRQVNQLMDSGSTEEEARAITASNTAVPGTSEHHTGLAIDIVTPAYTNLDDGFAETPAFKWLDEHAVEYGFILRFPKNKESITNIIYEPWHYRYVGVGLAKDITDSGLCLEEYIASVQADYEARVAAAQPAADETAAE